jgi:hypothetical protein
MRRPSLPVVLVGLGVFVAALALLGLTHPLGRLAGPALAALGLVLAKRRAPLTPALVVPSILAAAFAVGASVRPEFAADAHSYYVYLRSAYFDHDLDFANEWTEWGFEPRRPTSTGMRPDRQSVGPAVLWLPFYGFADASVGVARAVFGSAQLRDGYGLPYRRAAALGTITIALLGAVALFRLLERRWPRGISLLAVVGTLAASFILYYVFVAPAMAHGIAFALAAVLLWAGDRTRRSPSVGNWLLVGGLLGLLALTRWQALVYVLFVAPLAIEGLMRRTVRPLWLVAGAAVAVVAFLPQLVAWKVLYGSFLTIPQGGGFLDWSSPHFLDTLVSGDHGFFSWTPAMFVGYVGLALLLRREPLLCASGVAILLATAWINGSVTTWAGGDAFGARRFDICVPFAAIGLAHVVERAAALARRSPVLFPASALALLVLWNVSFIASFREQRYPYAAPIDRLAGDHGRNLRRFAQQALGWVAGARGRALAYKFFSGEYFYENYNWDGTINLATLGEADLSGGWTPPRRKPGGPGFRWALHPSSCVRIPLGGPVELPVAITVRAPRDAQPQRMTVSWNGTAIGSAAVGTEWAELKMTLPASAGVPGENHLCFAFTNALPSDNEGSRLAAQIAKVQLP